MVRERWQLVDRVFKSALERAPGARDAFLAEACAGDENLRAEVESLLANDEAGSFMQSPSFGEAARALVQEQAETLPGQPVGPYRVIGKLGEGGMGVVYLAVHAKTQRRVALKLLPAHFTADPRRVARFEQEARAVLALNHPNIVTVYDIGRTARTHFIVTELVEGETLRCRVGRGRLAVQEAIDLAIQIACALAAAHEAGVVHRDIKPENVMLRRDGYVKVLDFGLAKLTEKLTAATPAELEASTRAQVKTDAGTVLGTVNYMSPEQARGEAVDARTDIWSLGCVLYELAAGRRPFEGETTNHVVVSILEKEPPVLSRHGAEAPAELERIVSKALAKDRDERYQTAKDLLNDLRRLKRRLEVEAELERSAAPGRKGDHEAEAAGAAARAPGIATADERAPGTAEATAAPTAIRSASLAGSVGRRKKAVALVALVALAAAGVYYFNAGLGGGKAIDSIAVLPLVNTGDDPGAEYLSDGLTENIINSLSQLPGLKVMSRNSVFRFKGRETDAREAGRALGVRAVLTGRVVQRGDGLSINVELVDARDNAHLWGAQYDRKLADILAVQGEIAKEISEKLRLRLSGAEQKLLARRDTDNSEAYQLYLKGNYFWNKFTPEAERTAIDYYTQAIIKDPNFVPPYAGLVHGYQVSANNGWMRPHDAYPKAKAAMAKGLELDPHNPSLLTAAASTAMFYDWDWAAAESGFKRANEVDPDYWHHHELYAYLLTAQGRTGEAFAEARRAQEIDPLSLIAHASAAHHFYFSRQYDRSTEQARRSLELDPRFAVAHTSLARNFVQQGMYEEAVAEYGQGISLMGRTSQYVGELGHAYAVSGRRAEAIRLLAELREMSARQYVSPLDFAFVHAGLGDKARALEHLERAYQERSTWLMWIKVDPRFDPLRSEPRFAELMRRMKLAP